MSEARITLERQAFQPGETIAGVAEWTLAEAPVRAELRLFWETRGKGTRDVGVEATIAFEAAGSVEARPFSLRAPDAPRSVTGRLIAVVWAVELVLEPGETTACEEIVIGPHGREISLERPDWLAAPDPRAGTWGRFGS